MARSGASSILLCRPVRCSWASFFVCSRSKASTITCDAKITVPKIVMILYEAIESSARLFCSCRRCAICWRPPSCMLGSI
uniref:Putative secreted protein n=1 Tax=Anopheles marajoara TaxID=58244 RepID=A0A2M4CBP0_9DIPT